MEKIVISVIVTVSFFYILLPWIAASWRAIAQSSAASTPIGKAGKEDSGLHSTFVSCSPDALVVRDIGMKTKATLFVRQRSKRAVATGQLIIWSTEKPGKRIQDSYYDLGQVRTQEFGESVIAEFVKMAKERIGEFTPDRIAKDVPQQGAIQPSLPQTTESAVTPIKHSSVHRGEIVETGMMPRVITEGSNSKEITCYGMKIRTSDGILVPVWGTHLRTALSEAKAVIGDTVEIIKVGKRTMEKGKAPMNLYQVTKI